MNEQGTYEWRLERLCRPTASRFGDVMAGPKSAAWLTYARQLRGEMKVLDRISAGHEVTFPPDFYAAATEWGKKHEPKARAEYAWRHDCEVLVPTFKVHDSGIAGASADGIRGINDGLMKVPRTDGVIGVEIKCPFSQQVHAQHLAHGMPDEHRPQVQGGMWVYNAEAWDFVSFDPRRKDSWAYFEQRIERDDAYIAILAQSVSDFYDFVLSDKDEPSVKPGLVPGLF